MRLYHVGSPGTGDPQCGQRGAAGLGWVVPLGGHVPPGYRLCRNCSRLRHDRRKPEPETPETDKPGWMERLWESLRYKFGPETAVQDALRAFHLRVQLCPCARGDWENRCLQCKNDREVLCRAWVTQT